MLAGIRDFRGRDHSKRLRWRSRLVVATDMIPAAIALPERECRKVFPPGVNLAPSRQSGEHLPVAGAAVNPPRFTRHLASSRARADAGCRGSPARTCRAALRGDLTPLPSGALSVCALCAHRASDPAPRCGADRWRNRSPCLRLLRQVAARKPWAAMASAYPRKLPITTGAPSAGRFFFGAIDAGSPLRYKGLARDAGMMSVNAHSPLPKSHHGNSALPLITAERESRAELEEKPQRPPPVGGLFFLIAPSAFTLNM